MATAAPADLQSTIEQFLRNCREPALLEPGEEILRLSGENYALSMRNSRLVLQAWDEKSNLVRRVTGVRGQTRGRLELVVERFARKEGSLFLLDLAKPAGQGLEQRAGRLVFRERFRQFLKRDFPDWTLAELSAEADLEHSLSPAFPRALLKRGQSGWAVIGAGPEGDGAGAILSFGLIWLDYLRRREKRLAIEGLILFLPAGHERTTCLRVPFLDPEAARCQVFSYSGQDYTMRLDPSDFGNLETRVEVCRRPHPQAGAWCEKLADIPGVVRIEKNDGTISLCVRGLEFAREADGKFAFGLARRKPAGAHSLEEVRQLARELAARRSPDTPDREHPLYRRNPEAWLESQVRAHLEELDASLASEPIYGQVPAFTGGDRGIMDLLAVDRSGRLAVLELKAAADLQLPLQALDYWMRVKWHLDRREFSGRGYFPGVELRPDAPRLILVSPALEFHPTTEVILSHFSPSVDVQRIGVGLEWRKKLEIMFRFQGSQRP